jgi:hypothetical protein
MDLIPGKLYRCTREIGVFMDDVYEDEHGLYYDSSDNGQDNDLYLRAEPLSIPTNSVVLCIEQHKDLKNFYRFLYKDQVYCILTILLFRYFEPF